MTSDANGRFSFVSNAQLCGIRIFRQHDAYEAPYLAPFLSSAEPPRPMMLFSAEPGATPAARNDEGSPVPRTYVVDPIEVRARGDGPLELVVRLARPVPRRGDAFGQLAAPPARD